MSTVKLSKWKIRKIDKKMSKALESWRVYCQDREEGRMRESMYSLSHWSMGVPRGGVSNIGEVILEVPVMNGYRAVPDTFIPHEQVQRAVNGATEVWNEAKNTGVIEKDELTRLLDFVEGFHYTLMEAYANSRSTTPEEKSELCERYIKNQNISGEEIAIPVVME